MIGAGVVRNVLALVDSAKAAVLAVLAASSGAQQVGFVQAGAGAVARDLQAKGRDVVSVADYASAAAAVTATPAGGTILVPNGVPYAAPANYTGCVFEFHGPKVAANVYSESGETTRFSKRILRGMSAGAHAAEEDSLLTLETRPVGSGTNGPTNADYGLTVSAIKQNAATTAVVGEIDAISVVVRQGGTTSDSAAFMSNAVHYGTGFIATLESETGIAPAGGAMTQSVRTQLGVCDNVGGNYYGFVGIKETGAGGHAIQLQGGGTATWDHYLQCLLNGAEVLSVNQFGQLVLTATSGATPGKTIRAVNGNLSILNDAANAEILTVSDVGALTASGAVAASSFTIGGAQVVGPRDHGWGAASNGSKAAFNGATATLAQTSAALASVIAALQTHGLLGT